MVKLTINIGTDNLISIMVKITIIKIIFPGNQTKNDKSR